MVALRVFNYYRTGILASTDDEAKVKTITEEVVETIQHRTASQHPDMSFSISNLLINDLAQLHADKWVENIALHVGLYSTALSAPEMSAPVYVYNNNSIQKIKNFSGDVSGVIGETLLTVVMQRCYQLDDQSLAHFRAHKTIGIYPDFGIFFVTAEFQNHLINLGIADTEEGFQRTPIPCEVKTITTMSVTTGRERVTKAIAQIQSYWKREKAKGVSILCIAIRNSAHQAYDINLVWCN